ncbi:uncharacterized protein CBL_07478 [Carabus blaptoides fortunei]
MNLADFKPNNSVLLRRKRYVVFPEGASVSVAMCFTVNTLSAAPTIFTESVNWGIAYDLPNETSTIQALFGSKHVHQRRSRRELYEKMELVMDSMGIDGRICIFRALCETEQRVRSDVGNILEELVRIVFRFPLQRLYNSEPEIHRLYHWARRMGREQCDCNELFQSCQYSLLDIILQLDIEYEELQLRTIPLTSIDWQPKSGESGYTRCVDCYRIPETGWMLQYPVSVAGGTYNVLYIHIPGDNVKRFGKQQYEAVSVLAADNDGQRVSG